MRGFMKITALEVEDATREACLEIETDLEQVGLHDKMAILNAVRRAINMSIMEAVTVIICGDKIDDTTRIDMTHLMNTLRKKEEEDVK